MVSALLSSLTGVESAPCVSMLCAWPSILCVAEHKYTKANLRFEHLKVSDKAIAHALGSVPGFTPYLMLATRTLTGRGETDAGMYGG